MAGTPAWPAGTVLGALTSNEGGTEGPEGEGVKSGRHLARGGRLAFMAVAVLAVALTAVVVGVAGNTADSVPRAAAHDRAVALLNKVVLPAGAVRRTRAPTALLDWPDRGGSATVVRMSRFWTVPGGTALEVQHALGALQPNDLHPDGRSYAGGAGPEQEVYGLRYAAAPEGVVVLSAALVGPRVVGVRADVEVTYHPLRGRRERVPDGDTTALVEVVDGRLPRPLSSISLRGPDSRRLADLVNALQVAADGGRTNCPGESLKHRRVTFTGSGPTVVLTDGVCTGLTFRLDGKALPRLKESGQLDAELRRLAPVR